MTPSEAVAFLAKCSFRNHKAVYRSAGPSHGDPGGYSLFIDRESCQALGRKEWKALEMQPDGKVYPYSTSMDGVLLDESKCTCGALQHNQKVRELAAMLTALVTEPADTIV